MRRTKYDEEVVYYCKNCLSLAIRDMGDKPYCDKCGYLEVGVGDISEWADLHKEMYGEDSVLVSNYFKNIEQ